MNEYTKQGEDFLKKYKIKFKAKFVKYDKYFDDDTERRDIYRITFSRYITNSIHKQFSFTFGESINGSTGDGSNPPRAYDVITCLQKYDVGSFRNFCGDFGYDQDSRKAEKIYKNVMKEYKKVKEFFTEEELEEMQEIQ